MLVSLEDMKTYLGIPDATYDTFLTEQLTMVSSTVENYCGRVFAETSYVQTYYGDDYSYEAPVMRLSLFHYPVTVLTSVVDSGITLASSEYRVRGAAGSIYRIKDSVKGTWFTNYTSDSEVVITYTAGYATIPPEIDMVVKSLVEETYNKKVNGVALGFGSDVQRVSIPGTIAVDFDYSLQANERKNAFGMILGNYVNVLDFFRSERALNGEIRENYVS